jgi:two-component system sensor histidine kinase MtrB
MSPAEAARVFDRFWRADPARARTTGGSGLGLSIATEDTKLHNGWLQAWGNTGVGSNFRLTLPLKQGGTITKSPLQLEPADVGLPGHGDHTVLVLGGTAAGVGGAGEGADPAAEADEARLPGGSRAPAGTHVTAGTHVPGGTGPSGAAGTGERP